jgi:hypothetical protein
MIIENYFGKLNQRFRILSQTFRSEKKNFAMFFEACCAVTNFDIVHAKVAFRKEDQDIYIGLIHQIKREGKEKILRVKEKAASQYLRRMEQFMQTETLRPERRPIKRFKTIKLSTSRIFSKYSDYSD